MSRHHFVLITKRRRTGRGGDASLRQASVVLALAALAFGAILSAPVHAGFAVSRERTIRPGSMHVTPKLVLPAPRLAVVRAKVAFPLHQHCDSAGPIVIASIIVRNTGGPLVTDKGHIYASEDSGVTDGRKRMVSHGMPLGVINPQASVLVSVPIFALAPYSELVGTHQLTVHFSPVLEAGKTSFPTPRPYHFSVTIPKGFCGAKTRTLPTVRRRPPPGVLFKLNPQPEPPSRR